MDMDLLRQILNTPFSVPSEGVYLELGCLNIGTILKARRINYLHTLLKQDPKSMLYNFFYTQWKYNCKNDWTDQVKKDLADFEMSTDLDVIRTMSTHRFKKIVRIKAKEFAFYTFLEQQASHSKLDNIVYTDLKLQEYLKLEKITPAEAQILFRTRMANFSENFRGYNEPQMCPLCKLHMIVKP